MKVFLLHPGRAHYPELDAYASCLAEHGFDVARGDVEAYRACAGSGLRVLWCVMGFYPALPPADVVIHDYRSLSVGRLGIVKDGIKRFCQPRPNLRVFQNERLRDALAFRDGVPSLLLPMGVPDWLFDVARDPPAPGLGGVYCYAGAMSRERGFHRVLAAFRDRPRAAGETLVLVGEPEPAIHRAFRDVAGIVFAGRLPQREALDVVRRSDFALGYFPYHRPHRMQTPTKLLEYAALGKSIICNNAPANLETAAAWGIRIQLAGRAIFDCGKFPRERVPNDPQRLRPLAWRSVIAASGVLDQVRALLAAAPRRR
ncbi:glycosyltransferase [Burkholderia guangdongensis]|uniref:glycosyltransferase n=1 Tax=Burkholderia guangdongensis TaxID=1792500 RepID=UPI0015C8FDB2|nr:glycosyltransferase [Burkholderia guangdongensis]